MRPYYPSCPTKQDIVQGKVCGRKIRKDHLTIALVVNTTCTNKLSLGLFTNLYAQDALEGGLQINQHGRHYMYWKVG